MPGREWGHRAVVEVDYSPAKELASVLTLQEENLNNNMNKDIAIDTRLLLCVKHLSIALLPPNLPVVSASVQVGCTLQKQGFSGQPLT
jgi:hypothetical protein